MLHRSTWSGLLLSAAVFSTSLLGAANITRAQESAPASAPAEAPKVSGDLKTLADDFLHYSLVNNEALAKANAEAIVKSNAEPKDLVAAFEAAANGRDPRQVIEQDLQRAGLRETAGQLLEKLDEGYRAVARDAARIRADIDRLANGPRAYANAKDHLQAAGPFAAPLFIEYLQNGDKASLHPYIIRVMGEIGRPLLLPLVESLNTNDVNLQTQIIRVIGNIGYPQALPALRALQNNEQANPEAKQLAGQAIAQIDRTGSAEKMSPADLHLKAGQNYYEKKPSYQPPLANEKNNPIWIWDNQLRNVQPMPVPTVIWNDVMALRAAENTLKADANNAAAISLWLSADLRKEIETPAGATDPTRDASKPDASYYALAAGPVYVNAVLDNALNAHDVPLALRAIDALEQTGGVKGLISGANAPIIKALGYGDRNIRYRAAFTLARANPSSQFTSHFRVVPTLADAISSSNSATAIVVSADADKRNKLADVLRNSGAHYTVFAGTSLNDALDQAKRAPAIDAVVVTDGPEVAHVGETAKTDFRLSNVPVLVASPAGNLDNTKLQLASQKGYAAIDEAADDAAITAAIASAKTQLGAGGAPDQAQSDQYSKTALDILNQLADDHKSIYNVNDAEPALAEGLKDKRGDVVLGASSVLGKLIFPDAQKALAAAALSDAEAATRVKFYSDLAESAIRNGNTLDSTTINAVIKVVSSDPDVNVRKAAARALGALNIPSNQAATLILQQAK